MKLLAVAIFIVLGTAGLSACSNPVGDSGGTVIFGTGIDNSNATVTGQTSTFPKGTKISYSFQPNTSVTGGAANIEIDQHTGNAVTVADNSTATFPSGSNQFADTYDSSALGPGNYTMYVNIANHQTVAQGDFTITP